MTLAEHWDQTAPTVVSLPDFAHLLDLRPGGWRSSQMFTEPSGDYSRWQWARNRIQKTLTGVIQHQALPTPSVPASTTSDCGSSRTSPLAMPECSWDGI
ncbi:hypothetical protein [Catenulispora sp. GAS73]|uniref:hypothetical protein n=1 Tax=Catenulispora sp. GAS73 TaxID=3156269 RepID=UPI003517610F